MSSPLHRIDVAIVLPDESLRASMRQAVERDGDCRVVLACADGGEFLLSAADAEFDVALFWAAEPRLVVLVHEAAELGSGVLVLSAEGGHRFDPPPGVACGALHLDTDGPVLRSAIRAIAYGLCVSDPALELPAAPPPLPQDGLWELEPLTLREQEVLDLVAQGLPNKQIAERLSFSIHTAKFHVASILQKLGATSRTEAVAIGARHGLVAL